jgi:hypothetical protein
MMAPVKTLLRDIDALLRGQFTKREDLQAGRVTSPVRSLVVASLLLGGVYGMFMGLFALLRSGGAQWGQIIATTIKVPLLFLLTLVVTFPSLYVFSALARSKLAAPQTLRILLGAIAVNLAVLASFGPVTGFFTLSTSSYPFMIVLNVVFFGIGGLIGVGILRKALDAVFERKRAEPMPPPPDPTPGELTPVEVHQPALMSVRRDPEDRAGAVFRIWAIIFGVVGAQMGWILRPFVGTPSMPFELFRARESNFFAAVIGALRQLFS